MISGLSGVVGAELVLNWESEEATVFIYGGPGHSAGAGANGSVYLALIGNAPDNAAYSGPSLA